MSHLEKILDETFGKKKPKQVEVAVERLHPPMAPPKEGWTKDKHGMWVKSKPIASEKSVEDISEIGKDSPQQSDSKLSIDFNAIANASEFRRFVYWIRTGQVFRGSNEKLDIELNKTQEDLDIVKLMKKQQKPLFMSVMNEYKNKVEKLKERGDKNES